MAKPAQSSRRAARIRQIRERQRAVAGGGGGGGSSLASPSGAANSESSSPGAASKRGNEDDGIAATPSMMSEGDGSSVTSSRSNRLNKAQRAAAYRARKLAKAKAEQSAVESGGAAAATATATAAAPTAGTAHGAGAASHPPHPPASHPIPKSSMLESPRLSNRSVGASSVQIETVVSSASDVMSTASSFTTSSQMTAKVANTLENNNNMSSQARSSATRSRRGRTTRRSASAPRAGRSPAPSASSTSSAARGGSRSASLQKLRAQSPALLRRTSSHGGGSSVSSSRSGSRSRSRSVDKRKIPPPAPPTPTSAVRADRASGSVSPAPSSDIDLATPLSPGSQVSSTSSKSEHLSVEKGLRLIKKMHNESTTTASSSVSNGRTPSPLPSQRPGSLRSSSPRGSLGSIDERERQRERHHVRASRDPEPSDAPCREPASPFSRPDPPRESPTPSVNGRGGGSGSAWDRAQHAVHAQMNAAREILDASPSDDKETFRHGLEPEEVHEPSPAPAHRDLVPAIRSQKDYDAKVLAEQEVRELEARAIAMKRQMERHAEILERQEMEMGRNERQLLHPDPMDQDYMPPHVPPSPQFSSDAQPLPVPPSPQLPHPPPHHHQQQQWEHEPPLRHSDDFDPAGNGMPPPILSSPYPAYPPNTNDAQFSTAPVAQPYGSSSPMMQHHHSSYSPQPQQQQSVPPSHTMGQHYHAHRQDHDPYYQQQQQPAQLRELASYQREAVDPYQAAASAEERYRQYTLSPPNQPPSPRQAHGMPAASPYSQHHHQRAEHYHPAEGSQPVAHMHYESQGETYSYSEANTSSGVNGNHHQQSRETIESMAVDPHMQQYSYAGNVAPKASSEANASESSFEASSVSHLTASTFGTASPHRRPAVSRDPAVFNGTPAVPTVDFPREKGPFEQERKRHVAPLLSPQEIKAPQAMGFETDSESMFDDPTFSPQSAENQSVASKAVSEASKSGISWWKDPYSDRQGEGGKSAVDGNNATSTLPKTSYNGSPHSQSQARSLARSLGTVEESVLDEAGFPVPSPAAKSLPSRMTASLPPHHPVRSASPVAMNSVASGQASHFTAGSVASEASLGKRLAAELNLDVDDDEDIFGGIDSPTGRESEPNALVTSDSLPNDDIFDGVASPVASATARSVVANSSKMSATSKVSSAVKSGVSAATESKASATLNTLDGPKALMDDATTFIGTASLGGSKRSSSNMDGSGQNTLNLEYSNSTRETSEKVIDGVKGDLFSPLNEPATDGVLGISAGNAATGLDIPPAAGGLGLDSAGTNENNFVMEMGNNDILEFATHHDIGDAGTITSDITSSIIDMGPTAKKEAYNAHVSAQASKYEPKSSPIEEADESKSRASAAARSTTDEEGDTKKKSRESSTFSDGGSNYEDEETFDPDRTLDTTRSKRGKKSARRKREKEKRRHRGQESSRRRYDGSDDSYSEDYDDFTRGGSTVMTSVSRDSSVSGRSSNGVDFFSRYGCGVLDAIAANCGGQGPRPTSFDDRSLDGDETYTYNEEPGESFDKTMDNSTLVGTASVQGGNALSAKEQKVWDAWDKKDSETMIEDASHSLESRSMGTATHLEELELRQRRAQHLERRARAHEKLLLHAYSAMSLPPPPPGVEKGEDQAESVTPTSNSSSNAENKEPDENSRKSFSARDNDDEEKSMPYSTAAREVPSPLKPQSPMQIKPKPPSAPTGSKMLAAKSAILQRQTLEKFCIRLKNQGIDVLKMNHNKKWQDRVLTVSKEVNYLSQDKDSIFSDRLHCPQGLLWAKKFNTKTREHSVSDIDKSGKGGMMLQTLQGASLGSVADYPLAKKQLQGEFKDSVVVVLHAAENGYPGNLRDIVLRCKSMEEATFLCSGCKAIAEILHRDAEAKIVSARNEGSTSNSPALDSSGPQVLSPKASYQL